LDVNLGFGILTAPENGRTVFAAAEVRWRQYLLGQAADPGTNEFHIMFVDVAGDSTFPLPAKWNWYMARAFDGSPIFTAQGSEALSYVKLPRLITLAFISPRNPNEENWNGTQIDAKGTIQVKQNVSTTRFGKFLLERAKLLGDAPTKLTDRQKQKLLEQARTNPQTFLNSDSFQVHLADRRLRAIEEARLERLEVKGRDRNKPCPCGSGIKAKKCHGRP
jgi:hypothetical protein